MTLKTGNSWTLGNKAGGGILQESKKLAFKLAISQYFLYICVYTNKNTQ